MVDSDKIIDKLIEITEKQTTMNTKVLDRLDNSNVKLEKLETKLGETNSILNNISGQFKELDTKYSHFSKSMDTVTYIMVGILFTIIGGVIGLVMAVIMRF